MTKTNKDKSKEEFEEYWQKFIVEGKEFYICVVKKDLWNWHISKQQDLIEKIEREIEKLQENVTPNELKSGWYLSGIGRVEKFLSSLKQQLDK